MLEPILYIQNVSRTADTAIQNFLSCLPKEQQEDQEQIIMDWPIFYNMRLALAKHLTDGLFWGHTPLLHQILKRAAHGYISALSCDRKKRLESLLSELDNFCALIPKFSYKYGCKKWEPFQDEDLLRILSFSGMINKVMENVFYSGEELADFLLKPWPQLRLELCRGE